MQSLLYLLEEADAYRKAGKLGLALKRYVGIEKVRYFFIPVVKLRTATQDFYRNRRGPIRFPRLRVA